MRFLPWVVLAFLLLRPKIAGGGGPRSLRNKNPGNIKLSTIPWQGKVPNAQNTDGTFEQFTTFQNRPGMVWGTRAMIKELIDSIINDGNNTLTKLIKDWTAGDPPANQQNYITYVSNMASINPTGLIQADKSTLRKLTFTMADWEAGLPQTPVVPFDLFEESYALA